MEKFIMLLIIPKLNLGKYKVQWGFNNTINKAQHILKIKKKATKKNNNSETLPPSQLLSGI